MGRFLPAIRWTGREARRLCPSHRHWLWVAACAGAGLALVPLSQAPPAPPPPHDRPPALPARADGFGNGLHAAGPGSGRADRLLILNVSQQPYVPRRDEIPAEWADRAIARAPQPADRRTREGPTATQVEAEQPDFLDRLATGINAYRRARGLEPLAPDDRLDALADGHSRAMAASRRLSHDGFRERLLHTGSRMCVENVARNFRTVDGVLQGWQASPGHLRNLLEPEVTHMGLANRDRFVTLFACR